MRIATSIQTSGGTQVFGPDALKMATEAQNLGFLTTTVTWALWKSIVVLPKVENKDPGEPISGHLSSHLICIRVACRALQVSSGFRFSMHKLCP